MHRFCFAFAFASVMALGQQLSPVAPPSLGDFRAQAMQNALRPIAPDSQSFASRLGLTPEGLRPLLTTPMSQAPGNTCAIPLLTAPVNPATDPKIRHDVVGNPDPKAAAKAMPVCRK